VSGAVPLDRRQRRRQETIEQVLDVAAEVMAEEGVPGLTLGEVARRMGIRTPSLYVYFESKNALYDALFERGFQQLRAAVVAVEEQVADADGRTQLHAVTTTFVRWAVEHPAYTPLMFWRPVPRFEPSTRAYAPAVELSRWSLDRLTGLQREGLIRADVDIDLAFRSLTAVTAGVVSQQLTNAPHETFENGSFTATLPDVLDMWLTHYGRRE
jgi:AcrR family transcriptional regulator